MKNTGRSSEIELRRIAQEKEKGGESIRNCPLLATLRMFYSSARCANKKSDGEQGSGWEMLDGASEEDEGEAE